MTHHGPILLCQRWVRLFFCFTDSIGKGWRFDFPFLLFTICFDCLRSLARETTAGDVFSLKNRG